MKAISIAAFAVFAGCRGEQQPRPPASSPARAADSASILAFDDSVLDQAIIGANPVVTPRGDTLSNLGGGMMEGEGASDYGIDHYTKNGLWYVRVQQMTSRKPDGKAVWATRARLRLPPETSRENLATEGLCSVEGKNDPFIIAVTGIAVDSVSFQANYAWRFDVAQQTLKEIPVTHVTCSRASGDD